MEKHIPEYVDGLPNICGSEPLVTEARQGQEPVFLPESDIDFGAISSTFFHCSAHAATAYSCGRTGHRDCGAHQQFEIHDGSPGYGRQPQRPCFSSGATSAWATSSRKLVAQGKSPRVMLDYSGCLLHGLRAMGGLGYHRENCRPFTCSPQYRRPRGSGWETPWSHARGPRPLPAPGLPAPRAGMAAPFRGDFSGSKPSAA